MGDFVITFIIFFGVMAVTAVLFGGWVLVSILRFCARMIGGRALPTAMQIANGRMCRNHQCRTVNPPGARFCRRCGRELENAEPMVARRATQW